MPHFGASSISLLDTEAIVRWRAWVISLLQLAGTGAVLFTGLIAGQQAMNFTWWFAWVGAGIMGAVFVLHSARPAGRFSSWAVRLLLLQGSLNDNIIERDDVVSRPLRRNDDV